MNGTTALSRTAITPSPAVGEFVAAVGDFDGDGRSDFATYNPSTGAVSIWLMNGSTVVSHSSLSGAASDPDWRIAGAGDFDGDGRADLVWRNRETGDIRITLIAAVVSQATVGNEPDPLWRIVQVDDFNLDGKSDLLWQNRRTGETAVQYANGVSQLPARVTIETETDTYWRVASACSTLASQKSPRTDFGADGMSEILWRHATTSGEIAMWEMDAPAVLGSYVVSGAVDSTWRVDTSGDFYSDGTDDLIWSNSASLDVAMWQFYAHTLTAASTFGSLRDFFGDATWKIQGRGDFNGDGKADVVLRNDSNRIAIWLMDGNQVTNPMTAIVATLGDGSWQIVGIGDFYGTGKDAILWRDGSNNMFLWKLNGTTLVRTDAIAGVDSAWHVSEVGDFDGDGLADVAWRNMTTGEVDLWEMKGPSILNGGPVAVADLSWQIKATRGDYDGDGRADLMWINPPTGMTAVWQLNGRSVVTATTYQTTTEWGPLSLDRNADSGVTINWMPSIMRSVTMATTTAAEPPGKWWTRLSGVPPSALPVPAAPSANGTWKFAPAVALPVAAPTRKDGPVTSIVAVPPPWWRPIVGHPGWTDLAPTTGVIGTSVPSQSEVATAASARLQPQSLTMRRDSLYTPELQLMSETAFSTGTPSIAYEYIWFGGQPLAQIETATGAIHYYFNDQLGTPLLTTDATGAVDWRVEYEPYGRVYATRVGASRHQPLRFPGQEWWSSDGEREYNIFRWYRAGWGRYTQGDPIGISREKNLYAYVFGNPLGWVDPRGLSGCGPLPDCNGLPCAACCSVRYQWSQCANQQSFRYSHIYEIGATAAGALAGAAATRNLAGEAIGALVAGFFTYEYLHHMEIAAERAIENEYHSCVDQCRQRACVFPPQQPPPPWQQPASSGM